MENMEFKLNMESMEFRESKEFTVYKVSMDSTVYTVCMEFGAPEIGGHIDLHGKGLSWLQGRSIASLYTRRNILPQKSTRKYVHRELTRPLVGRVYITGQQAAASNRGCTMQRYTITLYLFEGGTVEGPAIDLNPKDKMGSIFAVLDAFSQVDLDPIASVKVKKGVLEFYHPGMFKPSIVARPVK